MSGNRILLLLCLLVLMNYGASAQNEKVKVACIGNSVTYGAGLKSPETASYPTILQNLLGTSYEVRNFGFSGATLLKKGHKPYYKTDVFNKAMSFKADVAIVHLGLNDTDPRNWPEYRSDFEADYSWLLDTLKKQNPKVKLYVCRLTPIFSEHPRFKSGTRDWYWQIQELIPAIAKANQAQLIDLNTPLHNRPDLFADNLHPDQEGAAIIAKTVFQNLTGDFGGLKLPMVFSDHMVMQRNQPIPVYGTANANEQVEVTFNRKKISTTAGKDGGWKVMLPAMPHGGPYELSVQTKSKNILLKDILLGDVWLSSGQSNMAFPLKKSATGKAEAQVSSNPLLRFMLFNPTAETNNETWDEATLDKINKLEFFSGSWQPYSATTAAEFSAVAYYFGKKIAAAEKVPVGLIQVAVGGSTIESWIDRLTLAHDPLLVDVMTKWRKSDFIQEWARGRADVNLKNATKVKQRHPYEPAYNYESGIDKLVDFPIKGVIWYQGESNAQNPELYAHSFEVLVNSWREKWGYQFPFYYVQLSGIDRPSWPYFRDVQRKLEKTVPNSYMAVSSDLGDSLDVHPTRKKEVGERLALQALNHTYKRSVVSNGPVAVDARKVGNRVVVDFAPGTILSTKDKAKLIGFEVITEKGNRLMVPGIIVKNKVQLVIPAAQKVKTVCYSWQPFSKANLVNEAALPASTFSMLIQ
ncbi:GDSL-type esterase/lipase family protein [Pedobacter nyackensis]|uniref:Sialate O-acetylesterase n=1 Tax=Pedobacter nyackensis TaxID=475255 RepID=A0A1W2DKJ0_9SPHI|nr:GDSL-type esterase/lipase family protein [Pedobacter nyackensis]SMC97562.1 sialate O-acetylesterase [Pedobacter nyackensis]